MPKQVSFEEENPLPVLRTPQQWKNEAAGSSEPESDRSDSSVQQITASAAAKSRSRRARQTTSKRSRTEISDTDNDATDIGEFSDRDSPEPGRASIRAKSRSQKSRTAKSTSDSVQSLYHLHRNPDGRPGRPWRFPGGYADNDLLDDPRDINAALNSVGTHRNASAERSAPGYRPLTDDELRLQQSLNARKHQYRGRTMNWDDSDVRELFLALRARGVAQPSDQDLQPYEDHWDNRMEDYLRRENRRAAANVEEETMENLVQEMMDMDPTTPDMRRDILEASLANFYDEELDGLEHIIVRTRGGERYIRWEMNTIPYPRAREQFGRNIRRRNGEEMANAISSLLANLAADSLETAQSVGRHLMIRAWRGVSELDAAVIAYIHYYAVWQRFNSELTNGYGDARRMRFAAMAANIANNYARYIWDETNILELGEWQEGVDPNFITNFVPLNEIPSDDDDSGNSDGNNAAGEFVPETAHGTEPRIQPVETSVDDTAPAADPNALPDLDHFDYDSHLGGWGFNTIRNNAEGKFCAVNY